MRRHHRTRPVALTGMLVLALVASACSGPSEPLAVGMREVASEVVLGAQTDRAPRPVPVDEREDRAPVTLPVVPGPARPPSTDTPPPPPQREPPTTPRPSPPPPPPADPCPAFDPLQPPRDEAFHDRGTAPAERAYPYRVEGEISVSGADPGSQTLETEATRRVEDVVVEDNGDLSFVTVTELEGRTTRTGYEVVNEELADPTGGAVDATGAEQVPTGVYLAFVETTGGTGAELSFHPAAPMKLLEFPAFTGSSYRSAGTDPASGVSMSFQATIGEKTLVNACGEPVQAITVELTEGRLDGPMVNLDFTATYDLATQYGGLPVRETVTSSGREGLDTVSRTVSATVNVVPRRAEGAA